MRLGATCRLDKTSAEAPSLSANLDRHYDKWYPHGQGGNVYTKGAGRLLPHTPKITPNNLLSSKLARRLLRERRFGLNSPNLGRVLSTRWSTFGRHCLNSCNLGQPLGETRPELAALRPKTWQNNLWERWGIAELAAGRFRHAWRNTLPATFGYGSLDSLCHRRPL